MARIGARLSVASVCRGTTGKQWTHTTWRRCLFLEGRLEHVPDPVLERVVVVSAMPDRLKHETGNGHRRLQTRQRRPTSAPGARAHRRVAERSGDRGDVVGLGHDPPPPPKTAAVHGQVEVATGGVLRSERASAAVALQTITLGPLAPEEKGGTLVVLLHGWGADGDDLVPLGRSLARPGTRFVVPAAPLARPGGGRAWWQLDEPHPAHAWTAELPPDHQPHPQLAAARAAVQALLRDVQQRYAPNVLAVSGQTGIPNSFVPLAEAQLLT